MSVNRNRMIGGIEDAIETGQSTVKKSAISTASDFGKSTKQQIAGSSSQKPAGDQGTNEAGAAPQTSDHPQMTDAERVEFLSGLYGKNNKSNNTNSSGDDQKKPQKGTGDVLQALGVPQKDPYEGKTPEEIAQIKALENRLHSEYYQNLVNRPKPKEEPVAEKLEREEEEKKMAELEQDKKKLKGPINPQLVKQGTGERVLSTVG